MFDGYKRHSQIRQRRRRFGTFKARTVTAAIITARTAFATVAAALAATKTRTSTATLATAAGTGTGTSAGTSATTTATTEGIAPRSAATAFRLVAFRAGVLFKAVAGGLFLRPRGQKKFFEIQIVFQSAAHAI